METVSRMHPDEHLTDGHTAEVEAFLATVKEEQARFLASIRQAGSMLGRGSGQLAHVAATHSRLTQQFFDAQRSIVTRRAQFDAEVAAIRQAAETTARQHVAAARSDAVSGGATGLPLAHPAVAAACVAQLDRDLARLSAGHEVAALGAAVVRTMAEATSLADVIDQAFEAPEPDGVSRQRQLATLLDDWWRVENEEGRAMVELAEARAAMRAHVAHVEAREVIATAPPASPAPLPQPIVAILDLAGSISLDSLLDKLAESLEQPVGAFAPPQGSPVQLVAASVEVAAPDAPAKELGTEQAFRDFWSAASVPVGPRRTFQWPKASLPAVALPTTHDGR